MAAANLINVVVPLVASAARTTSSNSGNLKDTTGNIPICESMAVYWIITASTVGPLAGAVVYIETSIDGGTTWVTAGAFRPFSGGVPAAGSTGAASVARRMDFHQGVFAGEVVTEQSASYSFGAGTTAATLGNTPLTRDNRVSWDIPSGSLTFSVHAICVPYGQRT